MQDRAVTEDRELTDAERLTLFRQGNFQAVLPNPPKVRGYHLCWLSTTAGADAISHRMRLGYTPVRTEEIPAWDVQSSAGGAYEGCVGVNEMVLFKVPLSLYEAFMKHNHHEAPLAGESSIKAAAEDMRVKADKNGAPLEIFEGITQLAERLKAPSFSDQG